MAAPTFAQLSPAVIDESPLNPRREFDAKALTELASSIAERGVLEPLLVRPVGERYEVIAGARRLRASKAAGLKSVPCMVREASDAELLAKKAPAVAKELKPRPASKPYDYAAENKKREQQWAAREAAEKALMQLASKKLKGDVFAVLDVLVASLNDYDMKHFSKLAGVPAGAKKLTDDQRLMVLLASAIDSGGDELLAKKLKVDFEGMVSAELTKLKEAEKQAEAAKQAAETTAKLKAADKAQAKKPAKVEKKAGKKAA